MKRRPHQVLVLAGLLAATSPAVAGDCWTTTKPLLRTGFDAPANRPEFAQLVRAGERAEALLRADPALAAIPGVRYQVDRSLTLADHEGGGLTATTRLRLHQPDVWKDGPGCSLDQGKADYFNRFSVEIGFNTLAPLLAALGANQEEGQPVVAAIAPEQASQLLEHGWLASGADAGQTAVRAARADGRPVLVPLTVGEHLARWAHLLAELGVDDELRALRAHRDGLDAATLARPAWINPTVLGERMWGYLPEATSDASALFQVAPDLLAGSGEAGTPRFVVASYSTASAPEEPIAMALQAWLEALDTPRLHALLREDQP